MTNKQLRDLKRGLNQRIHILMQLDERALGVEFKRCFPASEIGEYRDNLRTLLLDLIERSLPNVSLGRDRR